MGFEWAYRATEPPPWDIGAAQPAIVALEAAGAIGATVIDLGCGTGENALALAASGHAALGVDAAPTAIARATAKARERASTAEFTVADVLDLSGIDRRFETAIDVGCFHVFDDHDRIRYVRSVRDVMADGGRLYLLCFSERQPGSHGPRRVTQAEIRASFDEGWTIVGIHAAHFATRSPVTGVAGPDGADAWLATIARE